MNNFVEYYKVEVEARLEKQLDHSEASAASDTQATV